MAWQAKGVWRRGEETSLVRGAAFTIFGVQEEPLDLFLIYLSSVKETHLKGILHALVQQRCVQIIICFLRWKKKKVERVLQRSEGSITSSACLTHIEVSDPGVVLPELLQPRREVLHEPAALVVAHRGAPSCGEDGEDSQEGQEDKLRRHAASSSLLAGDQKRSARMLQVGWINPPRWVLADLRGAHYGAHLPSEYIAKIGKKKKRCWGRRLTGRETVNMFIVGEFFFFNNLHVSYSSLWGLPDRFND